MVKLFPVSISSDLKSVYFIKKILMIGWLIQLLSISKLAIALKIICTEITIKNAMLPTQL